MIGLLIVDDEETTRRGLSTCIDWRAQGLELVGVASSGLEALRELERHHPAIVILDVRMPEMDGLSLLSILRSRYPGTRAILVSGYEDFAEAQRAVNLSASAFLSKPVDEKLLLRKVREAAEAIAAEQSQVHSSEELRRDFDRLAPALRTSFLCRLVSSALGEEEACAQAAFLGLPIPADFPRGLAASAVVLELASPEGRGAEAAQARAEAEGFARFALERRAEAALKESEGGFAFPFGESVCLVAFHASDDRAAVRRRCKDLIDWSAASLGRPAAAGIGGAVDRLSGLCASYESARRALEYRFMVGSAEAIDVEDVMRHEPPESANRPSLTELRAASARIAEAVRKCDAAGAQTAVSALIAGIEPRLAGRLDRRSALSFLLSFVLTEVAVALGVHSGLDAWRDLGDCRTMEELAAGTSRLLGRLVAGVEDSGRRRDVMLARKAQDYMLAHVTDDISLTAVADALRVHPNYLSGVFRAHGGRTFIDYEISVKMDAARRLLSEGGRKVYEVADLLKYRDVNHFTRLFKKHVGVSPSEFRGSP